MQAQYKTKDDKYIIVKDKETGDKLRMKLAQEGIIPGNVKGWELFDIQKWTTTDFEREINVQRAIKGEIERQIKLIDGIQEVYLNIAFPKDTLFTTQALPVTATLTIIPETWFKHHRKQKKYRRNQKNSCIWYPWINT